MQIKTLQRSMLALLVASAILYSCEEKKKTESETQVTPVETVTPAPTPAPDTMTIDTGTVKPVVPTNPK